MKKILFFLLILISFDFFGQTTSIPDSNFEQALIDVSIDTDGLNGSILNSDAEQFLGNINVSSKNINNLTGIEAFINIKGLNCSNNNLTTLDLSSNTLLRDISAQYNNLVDINLNNITALQTLNIENNYLDSLNLSSHPDLYWLMCYTNNLTYLNISSNSNLTHLSCGENQLSGNLDISNLSELEFFACRYNQLSSVNIGLHYSMEIFNCQNNNIGELDLSYCLSLEQVYVDSNQLIAFNIKNEGNYAINDFHAQGNPNLYCIQVDDSVSSTNDTNWTKDNQSYYSEACNWASISEIKHSNFKIMPNPASDCLVVKMDIPQTNDIELRDINGRILSNQFMTNKETIIDIRNLAKGTYLIKIGQSVERFIKD